MIARGFVLLRFGHFGLNILDLWSNILSTEILRKRFI